MLHRSPNPSGGLGKDIVMTIFAMFGVGPYNGLLIVEKVLAKILNAIVNE